MKPFNEFNLSTRCIILAISIYLQFEDILYNMNCYIMEGWELLDKTDLEVLALFRRYSDWLKNNNFKDTINNYRVYFVNIEKVQFTYGDWY